MHRSWMRCIFALIQLLVLVSSAKVSISVEASVKHDYWWLAKLQRVATHTCNTIDEHRDISIVQHFTLTRFAVLSEQCDQWVGAIAAVLYVPIVHGTVYAVSVKYHNKPLSVVLDAVKDIHASLIARGCKVELSVFSEEIEEMSDWTSYPSNTMRNMALDLARTDIVLPLDADFIVCPKAFGDMLHDRQSHTAYRQLYTMLQDQRSLVVLPAFNVLHNATREGEHNITRGNKDALIAAIAQGSADIFQPLYHASTQYDVWFEAHDIYPIYYGTKGQPRAKRADYEPYFFAWRESLPSYDERFRGYHFNKLSYLFYLHSLGFEFHVHPDGWVAHMPHAKTRENLPWEVNNGENRRMRIAKIWNKEMPEAIASNTYTPVLEELPFARAWRRIHGEIVREQQG